LPSRNWKPKPFCFEDLILFEVPGVGVQFAGPGHLHSQRLVAFDPMPDVVPLKSKEPGTQGDAPRAVVHGWVAQLGREHVGVFRLGHPRVQQGILRRPVATKCTHQREILFLDPNFACCKSYKTGDKTLVITGSPFFYAHCGATLLGVLSCIQPTGQGIGQCEDTAVSRGCNGTKKQSIPNRVHRHGPGTGMDCLVSCNITTYSKSI
jgi:hypothetical protein